MFESSGAFAWIWLSGFGARSLSIGSADGGLATIL